MKLLVLISIWYSRIVTRIQVNKAQYFLDKRMWQTRDGRLIKVKDMDDNHVINTYRYLIKTQPYSKWVDVLKQEIEERDLFSDIKAEIEEDFEGFL